VTTDGIAVVAMTVTSLAQTGTLLWLGLRAVDRARLVSPPRQQAKPSADAATVEDLSKRRTGT
jgi:hypothetical protein